MMMTTTVMHVCEKEVCLSYAGYECERGGTGRGRGVRERGGIRELSEDSSRRRVRKKCIILRLFVDFSGRRHLDLFPHGSGAKACGSRHPLGCRHQWLEGVHE
uniref:Uncharacterized protein n=1 Tax=Opuntia streptacantha TaxID=393608 RepID=A0A7C9DS71_OPUST